MSTDEYQVAYERERIARLSAERILDDKTRELSASMGLIKSQYEVLKNSNRNLKLLNSVINFTQHQLSLNEALEQFIDVLGEATTAAYIIVYIKSKNDEKLRTVKITWPKKGFPNSLLENISKLYYRSGDGVPGRVLQSQEIVCLKGFELKNMAQMNLVETGTIEGCLALPIKRYGNVISVIEVGISDWVALDSSLISQIESVAKQMSVALERRHSQKETETNLKQLEKTLNDLQQAQNQLLQSEKMASLGQMAAGVAHEINNPVGFVLGNIEVFQEYSQTLCGLLPLYRKYIKNKPDDDQKLLEEIKQLEDSEDLDFIIDDIDPMLIDCINGLHRIKDIVNSLKSFARVDERNAHPADLNQCIENTLKLIWNEIKFNVDVIKKLGKLPLVECRPEKIEQVLMNLLINASHACDKNGRIEISSELKEHEVLITISDNGCGMDELVQAKIFDPFFTTKPINVGTGLGLSISYGIIQEHGGNIAVTSKVGEGTCFSIHLPLK